MLLVAPAFGCSTDKQAALAWQAQSSLPPSAMQWRLHLCWVGNPHAASCASRGALDVRRHHELCAANGSLPAGASQDGRAGLARNPGVLQDLPQGEALPGVPHQQLHRHRTALSRCCSLPFRLPLLPPRHAPGTANHLSLHFSRQGNWRTSTWCAPNSMTVCGGARLVDEVLGTGADGGLRGPLQVDLEDALVRLAVPLRLEGRAAEQELVAEHAQAPHVHRRVVVPPLHHLRGQVVQRPAQRLPARTAGQRSGKGIRVAERG